MKNKKKNIFKYNYLLIKFIANILKNIYLKVKYFFLYFINFDIFLYIN